MDEPRYSIYGEQETWDLRLGVRIISKGIVEYVVDIPGTGLCAVGPTPAGTFRALHEILQKISWRSKMPRLPEGGLLPGQTKYWLGPAGSVVTEPVIENASHTGEEIERVKALRTELGLPEVAPPHTGFQITLTEEPGPDLPGGQTE